MERRTKKNPIVFTKRERKRVLAIVLAILMVVSAMDFSGMQYVSAADESKVDIIKAFTALSGEIANQQLAVGSSESEINLPNSLSVTSEVYNVDEAQVVTGSAISVNPTYNLTGVTWEIDAIQSSSASFDSSVGNTYYTYVPVLPATDSEGISVQLADGVSLPQIEVRIEDGGKWAFSRSQTIDGIKITVKAEKDVFPEGAVLHAEKVTNAEDKEKIQNAISEEVQLEDTAKTVTELVSFDINITDADGNELQPDISKGEVRVSFAQLPMVEEASNSSQELKVFHMDDSLNEAKGLETTVDQEAGTLEAPAEHFSLYTVALLASQPSTYTYDITEGAFTINSDNLSTYDNATITGTVSSESQQLVIDGVTVNLTIEDLSITITGYGGNKSGIALKNGATLKLTVNGTNTLTGSYGGAGINVPQGCMLNITADSTGTLTATGGSGYGGGAGIGAVGNTWTPEHQGNVTQSVGIISIVGGTIIASGGSTYSYGSGIMGAAGIGGSTESTTGVISISGGTVTATGGYSAAGIGGGYLSCVNSIKIMGGTVTATGGYGGSAIGSGYNGFTSSTLSCGAIEITSGKVTANGNIGYGGAMCSSNNVEGSVSIETEAAVTINGGVILPAAAGISNYPISVTIYDGRLTSTIANASLTIGGKTYQGSINVSESYVGTFSYTLAVQGTLSGTQTVTVSGGGYSWTDISCSETSGSYSGQIGEKLYPVSLWFYDSVITADITGCTVFAQQNGSSLNTDPTQGGCSLSATEQYQCRKMA